jgi:hypothetical protein
MLEIYHTSPIKYDLSIAKKIASLCGKAINKDYTILCWYDGETLVQDPPDVDIKAFAKARGALLVITFVFPLGYLDIYMR